jgi:uncharacterized protein (TIGR04141 family)
MVRGEIRLEGLTIYLAKRGLAQPAELIKAYRSLRSFPIVDDEGDLGTLYVEPRASNPPRWGKFFNSQVDQSKLGKVSSTSAVLHTVVENRCLVLSFGSGWHLLQPNCWEDRFGLRVTLNSIGENSVRSIDKHTLDTIGRHSRAQSHWVFAA